MDQAGTGTMGRRFGWSRVLRWFAATLGVAAVTFLLSLARVNETAAGLVFLTMVVWFATRAGIRRSLYVALLCALCFDYYFLPPVHTFRLAGPQEWIEMLSFAVSCVIVGRLAERARSQTRNAEQRREDVERLYTLSQEMMLHEDAARLIRDMPRLVERRLRSGNGHTLRSRSGPVLCVDQRNSRRRTGGFARPHPRPGPDPRQYGGVRFVCPHAGSESDRSAGLAAGQAFP